MKFNFPNKEESVRVDIKFKIVFFEKIKDIAEREECLRSETIIALLEGAVEEYYRQGKEPKNTAYPVASKETNPDEKVSHVAITQDQIDNFELTCEHCEAKVKEGEWVDWKMSLYCLKCFDKERSPEKVETEQVSPLAEDEVNEFGHKIVGWSHAHDKCVSCGTTEHKHMSKGLCCSCYFKQPDIRNKKAERQRRSRGTTTNNAHGITTPVANSDDENSLCQYKNCPKNGIFYKNSDMKKFNNLFFCSQDCLEYFVSLNNDPIPDESSLTSSTPWMNKN